MRGSEDGSGGVLESLELHHGLWAVQYVPELRRRSLCAGSVESRTCENVLESKLDVAGVQGRRLDEGQVVLAWLILSAAVRWRPPTVMSRTCGIRTRKLLGLLGGHCPQMPQIALVSDQHDD